MAPEFSITCQILCTAFHFLAMPFDQKCAANEQETSSFMRNFCVYNGFDSNVLHDVPEQAEKSVAVS